MRYDLAVSGGLLATDVGTFKGTVLVKDGRIAGLLDECQPVPAADDVIDASGKVVMPGCIDAHVHIWEPGQTHRDDWGHGSEAAAAGGITTILELPLSVPPVKDEDSFNLKLSLAKEKSVVDFGLWGALTPDSFGNIDTLHRLGCVAFKGFISYANPDYPHLADSALLEAMNLLKSFNGITAVHAENADLAEAGAQQMKRAGRRDPLSHLESRETLVELEAIQRSLLMAKWTGARLHIVHMSIAEGAEAVKKAKLDGVRVTAETCPHFLTLDSSHLERLGPFAKCTPPLRRAANVEELWKYVFDGTIDFIASDHSAYTREEKEAGLEDIWKADPGFPGLQTMVPLMLSEGVQRRGLPLSHFVRLMSTSVAKVFRLYPKKGTLLPGSDADIAIVDLDRVWVVRGADTFYKCKWSPLEGMRLKGAVDTTIVRGKVVFQDGEIKVKQGHGEFQRPLS